MNAFYDEIHERYADPAAFVKRVKSKMQLHGITQADLARRSGFPPTHVSRWLGPSRTHKPSMETMTVLDEALDHLIAGE